MVRTLLEFDPPARRAISQADAIDEELNIPTSVDGSTFCPSFFDHEAAAKVYVKS